MKEDFTSCQSVLKSKNLMSQNSNPTIENMSQVDLWDQDFQIQRKKTPPKLSFDSCRLWSGYNFVLWNVKMVPFSPSVWDNQDSFSNSNYLLWGEVVGGRQLRRWSRCDSGPALPFGKHNETTQIWDDLELPNCHRHVLHHPRWRQIHLPESQQRPYPWPESAPHPWADLGPPNCHRHSLHDPR